VDGVGNGFQRALGGERADGDGIARPVKVKPADRVEPGTDQHVRRIAVAEHPERREYAGRVFAPGRDVLGYFTCGAASPSSRGPVTVRSSLPTRVRAGLVPAGFGERRFAVLDIGEDRMQDIAYFAAIDAEMDSGREGLALCYNSPVFANRKRKGR